jgi:predicted RNA-binding protein
MLLLVLAHGNLIGTVDNDIGSHQDGVSKKAGIDVVGLLADLLLERGCSLELANIGIHIKEKVKLGNLWNVALDINCCNFGVYSAGEVFGEDLLNVAVDVVGFRVSGKGVVVGDEEKAIILLLHFEEVDHCPEIIAEVKITCRPDAAYDCFHVPNFIDCANVMEIIQNGDWLTEVCGVRLAATGL